MGGLIVGVTIGAVIGVYAERAFDVSSKAQRLASAVTVRWRRFNAWRKGR